MYSGRKKNCENKRHSNISNILIKYALVFQTLLDKALIYIQRFHFQIDGILYLPQPEIVLSYKVVF